MSLKRVMFVDDDPMVLRSMRRVLRKEEHRWHMAFSLSGPEALAELAAAPADVVVSDMRMAEMDGVAFLSQVKDLYPATARIVLSGHTEPEAVMRCLAVAQQFLAKPFDGQTLRGTVERICSLHEIMGNPSLQRLVGRMAQLPSPANTFTEVSRLADDSRAGANEIARVMERDPAMSAKVLQLVNSAFFGIPQHVTSVQQGVVFLGLALIRALVLSAQVFGAFAKHPRAAELVDRFQQRSLQVAQLARRFLTDRSDSEEAFIGALLHDVGALVLALESPGQMERVADLVRLGKAPLEAELEVLEVTHAEVGAYLLGLWGLPWPLVQIAAFHHRPGLAGEAPPDAIAAVHVADALLGPSAGTLDLAFLERVGLVDRLPLWRELARDAQGHS